MNKTELTKELERLESVVSDLKRQIRDIDRGELLPILKEHARVEYHSYSSFNVFIENQEIQTKFMEYCLSASYTSGWGHFGTELSEITYVQVNDGNISLSMNVSGTPQQMQVAISNEMQRLGLKISFEKHKSSIQHRLLSVKSEFDKILEMEKEYGA
jgi:hypothetical protein